MRKIAINAGAYRLKLKGRPRWWRLTYAAYLRWRWLRRPD